MNNFACILAFRTLTLARAHKQHYRNRPTCTLTTSHHSQPRLPMIGNIIIPEVLFASQGKHPIVEDVIANAIVYVCASSHQQAPAP